MAKRTSSVGWIATQCAALPTGKGHRHNRQNRHNRFRHVHESQEPTQLFRHQHSAAQETVNASAPDVPHTNLKWSW